MNVLSVDLERLSNMIRSVLSLLLAVALTAASQPGLAGENPRVRLVTNLGAIILELQPDEAPRTVENFITYVQDGFYDGTVFHRVIGDFMIQGGGFTPDMEQKRTNPSIPNESKNGLANERGTIAMARTSAPHSATSQFFINVVDNDSLNFGARGADSWGYAVFGRVVGGMDVVDKIRTVRTARRGPYGDVPTTPVVIESARLEIPSE